MSRLREELEQVGGSLKDLTVLAPQNDPFRIDTPANHRDGAWLGEQFEKVRRTVRHLRGLHYALSSTPGLTRPDGLPYVNNDDNWAWLQKAAKAARWLRYIPFDELEDKRNTRVTIRRKQAAEPEPRLYFGLEVDLPSAEDLKPEIYAKGFEGRQPYKLVMFGEKSSLEQVLGPVAERFDADLYLASGELSDTLIHQIAADAAEDGRPLRVFTFCDADPAGWQMPISISRKLQAFEVEFFPGLDFEVHRVGLTPDQVREYGLPSTPLKDTEKRADRWQQEMGTAQTEIDAWLALAGDALRQEAVKAMSQFFDSTLLLRVADARRAWEADAQAQVDAQLDEQKMAAVIAQAAETLAAMRREIDELNNAATIDTSAFKNLPPMRIPAPRAGSIETYRVPLLDSSWSFELQCKVLIASKNYRELGGDA